MLRDEKQNHCNDTKKSISHWNKTFVGKIILFFPQNNSWLKSLMNHSMLFTLLSIYDCIFHSFVPLLPQFDWIFFCFSLLLRCSYERYKSYKAPFLWIHLHTNPQYVKFCAVIKFYNFCYSMSMTRHATMASAAWNGKEKIINAKFGVA